MRRLTSMLALVALMTTLFAGAALGAPPHGGCPVGPVNAGNSTIGAWERMDETTLAAATAASGFDPGIVADIFAKEDRNGDGLLCVMTQVLPNDASGSDIWFVSHDNNAREK
ncbi:MAG TPA: hypothetical protein VK969_06020 [Acidimicrobiia bacterium]|nr:hypothetical protein [Acidimicrobiia bacterium]